MKGNNKRKHRFLEVFGVLVMVLALVRCAFPGIAESSSVVAEMSDSLAVDSLADDFSDAEVVETPGVNESEFEVVQIPSVSARYVPDGERYHRIRSVSSYKTAFPDSNSVQLIAANRWGVKPVKNRLDAEERKDELVFIDCSPYYYIDPLHSSIPYLVPRAAVLLQVRLSSIVCR